MPRDLNLLALQREFMRALREPMRGASRIPTPLARQPGKTSQRFGRAAKKWITPSARLKPVERLELYHRQYWYRLLDSLAEDFPALRLLLGERRFWKLIEAYLTATPSRSYTLRHLGGRLSAFLKKNAKLAGPYPVHAAELAKLEYTVCENFEAAEYQPVAATELAATKLALQPHLQLFAFATPVEKLWRCQMRGKPIAKSLLAKSRQRHHVAVFRLHFSTRVEGIEPEAFSLLTAIAKTGSLEKAFKRAALKPDAVTPAKVQSWFQLWTERGWLCVRNDHASLNATKAKRADFVLSGTDDAQLGRAEKTNITKLKF
jgi:hypothetical protein